MNNSKPTKSTHTTCWILLAVLGAFLVFSLVANGVLFLGLMAGSSGAALHAQGGVDEFPQLAETWSYGKGDVKAVRISLAGFIGREADDGFFVPEYDKVEMILRQIRAAKHDERVRAIILEVDSPGGVITPSDEIYKALLDFKKDRDDRKIIVFMKDVAASGAYLVSMAGDWLIAEPTSMLGSIGVIIQTLNLKGMGEKIGVTDTTIKSGENKDLLNPFRDVTLEERALLQTMVDELYQYFFDIVVKGRGVEPEQLKPWADGRIFSSQTALENNLIDEIGYWDSVVTRTREMLAVKKVKIVRYEQDMGFWSLFSRVHVPFNYSSLMDMQAPRFLYLWRP